MVNGHDPSKEEAVLMIEQVETLNKEADQIKKASKAHRTATHRSLADLYEMLNNSTEFSEEKQAIVANN